MPSDLNARIAREVMGWEVEPVFPLRYSYRNEYGSMMSAPVPDFTNSLDACALAEAEIERRELMEKYRDILVNGCAKSVFWETKEVQIGLIRLTPAQRCAAMLKAVSHV